MLWHVVMYNSVGGGSGTCSLEHAVLSMRVVDR